MNKNKAFSLTPPSKSQTTDEFISKATDTKEPKPWEAPYVREDVIKLVSLRLPEPLYLKLKFLSEKTKASQQEIIFELLAPYLEEEVKKY